MGVTPGVFTDMTPAEFFYAWTGWAKMQTDRTRSAWERTRWSTYFTILPHIQKEDQPKVFDMLALPWDNKEKSSESRREMTMDERKAVVSEMLKCLGDGREKISGPTDKDRG